MRKLHTGRMDRDRWGRVTSFRGARGMIEDIKSSLVHYGSSTPWKLTRCVGGSRCTLWRLIHKHTRDFLRANVALEGTRSGSGIQVEKERGFLSGRFCGSSRSCSEEQNPCWRTAKLLQTSTERPDYCTDTDRERCSWKHRICFAHSSTYLQIVSMQWEQDWDTTNPKTASSDLF